MKSPTLNILLVEDDPGDADYLQEVISEDKTALFNVTVRDRLETGIEILSEDHFDAVLLDLHLPDSHGLETIEAMHDAAGGIPILVLTGMNDESTALKAMQEGAQDYLDKTGLTNAMLVRTIRYSIERQQLLQAVEQIRVKDIHRKDAFISHISHELRSPLTSIYQFVSLLLDGEGGDLNKNQHECLDVVMRNTQQLRKMIDDLLELSRADTGKLGITPRSCTLEEVIVEMVDALRPTAESKDLDLTTETQEQLPCAYADPARVRQVLTNLIGNAIKFTPSGGSITVQAQTDPDASGYLRVVVQDTGTGIKPENLEQIFDRLYQQNPAIDIGQSGLGLGLHICKELVESHTGRIWVESQDGEGSRFCFTLPAYCLENFLRPIIEVGSLVNDDLSLVRINIHPKQFRNLDADDEAALQKVREVVGQIILYGCDVLLPRLARTEAEETFFVVATADKVGAKALGERIAKQLGQCQELQNARLISDISFENIYELPTTDEGRIPAIVPLSEIARIIEGMIETNVTYKEVAT